MLFLQSSAEWARSGGRGCSKERAPEASGLLDTPYLDGFGEGEKGGSPPFLLSIKKERRGEIAIFIEIG